MQSSPVPPHGLSDHSLPVLLKFGFDLVGLSEVTAANFGNSLNSSGPQIPPLFLRLAMGLPLVSGGGIFTFAFCFPRPRSNF